MLAHAHTILTQLIKENAEKRQHPLGRMTTAETRTQAASAAMIAMNKSVPGQQGAAVAQQHVILTQIIATGRHPVEGVPHKQVHITSA